MPSKDFRLGFDLNKLQRDVAAIKREMNGLGQSAQSSVGGIDSSIKGLGKTVASLGVAVSIEEMARALYNFSSNFNKAMLEVATISDSVSNEMEGAKQKILELTTEIPIAADEATKALYQIVSAGYDGAAGMNVLEVSAKAAIGGVTDTATAADAITTLLNAYKLSADDAESVSDMLFTTVRLGKTTMGELGQSVAQVAPLAAAFGVEMDQVLAGVATLTKSGTPTAQAMTQIRAALTSSTKVLGDGYYATHTFQEGLSAISEMAGGSESKLRELIPEIEGMNGVLGLTGINAETASSDLYQLNDALGATEVAFDKMLNDSDAQLKLLQNNALKYFSDLGDGIMISVGSIAGFLNEAFANGEIERFADAVIVLVSAFGIYKGAVIAATTVQKLQNIVIKEAVLQKKLAALAGHKLSTSQALGAARTSLLSAAQFKLVTALKAVKVAMLSNPWTAAFVGITAVVTAIVLFKNKTDAATEAVTNLSNAINDEQTALNNAYNDIKKSETGTNDRRVAIEKFNAKYGSYLDNLLSEKSTVEEVAAAYDKAKSSIIDYQLAKAKDSYTSDAQEKYTKAETTFDNAIQNWSKELSTDAQRGKFASYMSQLKESIKNGTKATSQDLYDAYNAAMSDGDYESVAAFKKATFEGVEHRKRSTIEIINEVGNWDTSAGSTELNFLGIAARKLSEKEAEYESFVQGFKSTITTPKKGGADGDGGTTDPTTPISYGEEYRAAQKEWNEAKKAYEAIEKDRDSVSTKAYNDAKTRLETASKTFKDLGGNTSSKSINPVTDDDKKLIEGSIGWYEAQVSKLQKLRKSLTDPNDIAAVDKNIQQMQVAMGILNDEANVENIDKEALSMTDEYAERERKAYEERLKNYKTFAERYKAIEDEHKTNLELVSAKGGTKADVDAEDQRYEDDLKTLNDEVLTTIGEFESLGIDATDKVIDQMIAKLQQAKTKLEGDASGANNTTAIKAVNAEIARCIKLKEENNNTSQSRSLKEWQDMEKQLNNCVSSFNEIGDAVGGVAGEIISTAGDIAGSTISMISSIVQFSEMSMAATEVTAITTSASVQTVEKASVILAVISAVIQVAMKIASLFNDTEKHRENIAALSSEVEHLQWIMNNKEVQFLKDADFDAYEKLTTAMQEVEAELFKQGIEAIRAGGSIKDFFDAVRWEADETASVVATLSDQISNISYADARVSAGESLASTMSDVENLMEQNVLLQQSINEENMVKSKDRDYTAIDNWKHEIQENAVEAAAIINEAMETVLGGSSFDIASQLSDALTEAWENGEDAAESWGDTVNNVVSGAIKKMLDMYILEPMIEEIFGKYKDKWFNTGEEFSWQDVVADLPALGEEIEGIYGNVEDVYAELEKYYSKTDSKGRTSAESGGIASASQDSVDELNGRATAIQGHTFMIADEMVRLSHFAQDQLIHLANIDTNTARLSNIEKDIKNAGRSLSNIAKSIKKL